MCFGFGALSSGIRSSAKSRNRIRVAIGFLGAPSANAYNKVGARERLCFRLQVHMSQNDDLESGSSGRQLWLVLMAKLAPLVRWNIPIDGRSDPTLQS